MKTRVIATLALSLLLSGGWQSLADAAKKYYPPGFTPPSDEALAPGDSAAPQVIIQQAPGSKQVIIKTVPGPTRTIRTAKPKDPLEVLLDERRFYDARRLVEQRLKQSPRNTTLQMTRAHILREDRDYQDALHQYQSIYDQSKNKPLRADAKTHIGWTWYRQAMEAGQAGNLEAFNSDIQKAEEAFSQAAKLAPQTAAPWSGLVRIKAAKIGFQTESTTSPELLERAESELKRAQQLAANAPDVQLAHADLLLARHKPDEALQLLYGLKKNTTHEPDVYLLLARASLETGKIDDAIINLKQLLALMPENIAGLRLLSESYERKMKPEDAETVLEKAISLNPADVQSVEALLKIYDQRGESERSVLLLKTLLKDQPDRIQYAEMVMTRLNNARRWDEAYAVGHEFLQNNLVDAKDGQEPQASTNDGGATKKSAPSLDEARLTAMKPLINLFSEATYRIRKNHLEEPALTEDPVLKAVWNEAMSRLQASVNTDSVDLINRLTLLRLDPLAPLPPLPPGYEPAQEALDIALQVAFLEGDRLLYQRLLTQAQQSSDRLALARKLYTLGDYPGVTTLTAAIMPDDANAAAARELHNQAEADAQTLDEQLRVLAMLPRQIPESYWKHAANEALKIGSGYWQTHAVIAEGLEQRKKPTLALKEQRLAARFAPTAQERERWLNKAAKTANRIQNPRQRLFGIF